MLIYVVSYEDEIPVAAQDNFSAYTVLALSFNGAVVDRKGHDVTSSGVTFTQQGSSQVGNFSSTSWVQVAQSTDWILPASNTVEFIFTPMGSVQGSIMQAAGWSIGITPNSLVVNGTTIPYTWQLGATAHVAISCSGIQPALAFVDGVQIGTSSFTAAAPSTNLLLGGGFEGFITAARITSGVSRYASNFGVVRSFADVYAPPPSNSVVLNFTDAYTAPASSSVQLRF